MIAFHSLKNHERWLRIDLRTFSVASYGHQKATATCEALNSLRQARSKNVHRDSDKSKARSLENETQTTATHFVSNCTVCKSIAV